MIAAFEAVALQSSSWSTEIKIFSSPEDRHQNNAYVARRILPLLTGKASLTSHMVSSERCRYEAWNMRTKKEEEKKEAWSKWTSNDQLPRKVRLTFILRYLTDIILKCEGRTDDAHTILGELEG